MKALGVFTVISLLPKKETKCSIDQFYMTLIGHNEYSNTKISSFVKGHKIFVLEIIFFWDLDNDSWNYYIPKSSVFLFDNYDILGLNIYWEKVRWSVLNAAEAMALLTTGDGQ